MHTSLLTLPFVLFVSLVQSQTSNIDTLLGRVLPPPQKLSTNPVFNSFTKNLSSTIDSFIATNNVTIPTGSIDFSAHSFSISFFSGSEQQPLYQTSRSSPLLANTTAGTKTVDSNSVFRIGSVSKLLTVWLFLIEAGDLTFSHPITEYIPELRALDTAREVAGLFGMENATQISWSEITVGALASHMAGIQREGMSDPGHDSLQDINTLQRHWGILVHKACL